MYVDARTWAWIAPEIILILMATWIYVAGTFTRQRSWWAGFAVASLVAAGVILTPNETRLWAAQDSVPGGALLTVDYLGFFVRQWAIGLGVLFVLCNAWQTDEALTTEYLGTLLLLVAGVMLVARANDLVLLFVSLELVSIPTYILLYLGRRDRATSEAVVKYFLLSVLSSALLLYGFSFLYGVAGTTVIRGEDGHGIANALARVASGDLANLAPFGVALTLAGLGFKLGAVPFHFYAPDVYQGVTPGNAAILAAAPKVVGVVALLRLFASVASEGVPWAWQLVLVLSLATMTLGNVCALWQHNVRRLLAYSSIANGGYLLIGLATALTPGQSSAEGAAGMLLYLVVYVLATTGAFAALSYLGGGRDLAEVDELAGISRSNPYAAGALAVCLFSLAGLPPLAGFWGKLELFLGAIRAAGVNGAGTSGWLIALAVAGALNAAVAAAYYLRLIATLYFRSAPVTRAATGGMGAWTAAMACALLVVILGVAPKSLMESAGRAGQANGSSAGAAVPTSSSLSRR